MTAHTLLLTIPAEHPCYGDHFPGDPVVPGALLLQWVLAAASRSFAGARVAKVSSAKFLAIVRPGEECSLQLESGAHAGRVRFECFRGTQPVLKGALELQL